MKKRLFVCILLFAVMLTLGIERSYAIDETTQVETQEENIGENTKEETVEGEDATVEETQKEEIEEEKTEEVEENTQEDEVEEEKTEEVKTVKKAPRKAPIQVGDLTVDGDEGAYTYENHVLTIHSGSVTVSGTTTTDRIIIDGDAEVTIKDVSITASSGAAIKVNTGVTSTIILDGENTLKGSNNYAALEIGADKDSVSNVTIKGEGTLNATGGSNSAGIGGSKSGYGAVGNLTIKSGTINATGGSGGPGIGSVNNGSGQTGSFKGALVTGIITIDGGNITATGQGNGAGIGGGNHNDSGKIIINGGTINAKGQSGIGSGLGSNKAVGTENKGPGYYYADIEINGGTITAEATGNAAGIGGGMYCDAIVKITGGNITAIGGTQSHHYHHGGAGIGGGYLGQAQVTITGGTINAKGGDAAAGIGSGGAPNSLNNSTRKGSYRVRENVTVDFTTINITGGDITAEADKYGGAGIGGGTATDKVSITISGGTIKAYGSPSDESTMQGGAGIGSSTNAKDIPSETGYMVDTDLDVTITGGDILAIGGWGASGIGSGANNKTADTIKISADASIEAYADGTKFAIDTRDVNDEERDIKGNVLQGTFVKAGVIGDYEQNPEGLKSIQLINDETGETKVLKNMREGYRSFATNVASAGTYTIYTDEESIGKGEGRYFSECTTEVYDEEKIKETGVQYTVEPNKLSDQNFLFPVKSIIVEKEVIGESGLNIKGVNETFYFAIQEKSTGEFVEKDGSTWIESIKVVNGVPETKAYFTDIEDKTYDVWEVDKDGNSLKQGTVFSNMILKKIRTSHGDGTDNNATIDDTIWTDKVTVKNTFIPKYTPVTADPPVTKEITGDSYDQDISFTFTLTPVSTTADIDELPMPEGSEDNVKELVVDGAGDYEFGDITFETPGTYVYEIEEVDDASRGWTYDTNTYVVTYEVTANDNYELSVKRTITKDEEETDKVLFTNHYETPTTFTIEKAWDDENDKEGYRPDSINVQVYKDGKEFKVVTLNEDNDWSYTLNNLDNGEYSAKELDGDKVIEDGETLLNGEYTAYYDDLGDVYLIVNEHTIDTVIPTTTEVSVEKNWDDESDKDGLRPDLITVGLYKDDELIETIELNKENNWSYTFENLEEAEYQVFEIEDDTPLEEGESLLNDKYTVSYEVDDTTVTITNTHTPQPVITVTDQLTVKKVWEDNDNEDHIRPDSITAVIYKDDTEVQEVVLSEENSWTYTVTGLEEGDYTVKEKETGLLYFDSYSIEDDTYIITNTHELIKHFYNNVTKVDTNVETSDNTSYMIYIVLLIIAVIGVLVLIRKR